LFLCDVLVFKQSFTFWFVFIDNFLLVDCPNMNVEFKELSLECTTVDAVHPTVLQGLNGKSVFQVVAFATQGPAPRRTVSWALGASHQSSDGRAYTSRVHETLVAERDMSNMLALLVFEVYGPVMSPHGLVVHEKQGVARAHMCSLSSGENQLVLQTAFVAKSAQGAYTLRATCNVTFTDGVPHNRMCHNDDLLTQTDAMAALHVSRTADQTAINITPAALRYILNTRQYNENGVWLPLACFPVVEDGDVPMFDDAALLSMGRAAAGMHARVIHQGTRACLSAWKALSTETDVRVLVDVLCVLVQVYVMSTHYVPDLLRTAKTKNPTSSASYKEIECMSQLTATHAGDCEDAAAAIAQCMLCVRRYGGSDATLRRLRDVSQCYAPGIAMAVYTGRCSGEHMTFVATRRAGAAFRAVPQYLFVDSIVPTVQGLSETPAEREQRMAVLFAAEDALKRNASLVVTTAACDTYWHIVRFPISATSGSPAENAHAPEMQLDCLEMYLASRQDAEEFGAHGLLFNGGAGALVSAFATGQVSTAVTQRPDPDTLVDNAQMQNWLKHKRPVSPVTGRELQVTTTASSTQHKCKAYVVLDDIVSWDKFIKATEHKGDAHEVRVSYGVNAPPLRLAALC
jgi:hypothetical protein